MIIKKPVYYLIFLMVFLFSHPLNSYAQENGRDLLHSLQTKFNSLKNVSADFVEYTNGKKNLTGKFYYQKENRMRIELNNIVLVTDGISTWNYNKNQNKLIIDNYDPENNSILSLKNFIDVIPSKCSVKEKTGNRNIIELIPDSTELSFSNAEIKINSQNLIEELSINNKNGQIIKIVISNYKLNPGLSGSLFHINPPKGSKVIDLR